MGEGGKGGKRKRGKGGLKGQGGQCGVSYLWVVSYMERKIRTKKVKRCCTAGNGGNIGDSIGQDRRRGEEEGMRGVQRANKGDCRVTTQAACYNGKV